jgi:hypothetical protein
VIGASARSRSPRSLQPTASRPIGAISRIAESTSEYARRFSTSRVLRVLSSLGISGASSWRSSSLNRSFSRMPWLVSTGHAHCGESLCGSPAKYAIGLHQAHPVVGAPVAAVLEREAGR